MISNVNLSRFLIINPFGIGDVLFTTPVIRAVKEHYPQSFIGYWCNARVAGLLEDNPRINKVFALSRGDLKKIYRESFCKGLGRALSFFSDLRKEKFDIVFDYSLDHRYSFIAKLAGVNTLIGYDYKGRGRFLTHKLNLSGYTEKHAVEYYCDLLGCIGLVSKRGHLELFVNENARNSAQLYLNEFGITPGEKIVGIAAGGGASWGKDAARKHWPAVNFAHLADKLISSHGVKVVLLGDESEAALNETIKNYMSHKALDLTGKISLKELAGLISALNLLIANDGGPLHMAVALGRKTLSFFGPVDMKVYGPYPPNEHRHIVLKDDLECMPCYNNFRLAECGRNKECLEKISVQVAFKAAEVLLSH